MNPRFAEGVSSPEGPVILADGSVAIVEMGDHRKSVTVVDASGDRREICRAGGNPNGLAIDGYGRFWVAGGPYRSLICVSAEGKTLMQVDGDGTNRFLFPNDLAFGPDGYLYMTDSGVTRERIWREASGGNFLDIDYDGRVYQIDPQAGRVIDCLASGLRFTNGIAFGTEGALYYNETLTGFVYRLSGGKAERYANVLASPVTDSFKGPDGMAFAADGALYCAVLGEAHVCVLDPSGAVERRLPTNGNLPTNVAFSLTDTRLFVTEGEHGTIEIMETGRRGLTLHAPSW